MIRWFLFYTMLQFVSFELKAQHTSYFNLDHSWSFRQLGTQKWYTASVPGTIHTDLMAQDLIPDPFYRDNEQKVQWVSQVDWEYQTTFKISDFQLHHKKILLQFDGLDTYADIYLNDSLILQAENMFRTYVVDISQLVQSTNVLNIEFRNADKMVDSIAMNAKPLQRPCENNRNYVRKAQYHFGWDWAPKLTTCGIWRPVKIAFGDLPSPLPAHYSDVKLKQEKDSIGESFYFEVNGIPTFMKGANWIPADVFLPRITKDNYRTLLIAAKEANFNMLRVWGGGIYEDDAFYDLCDSLGIYIWQDFMFAGAMYPADTHFVENVKAELRDNITRLRKHKCIVIWCGNNEIDEAWHNWGWQKQFKLSTNDSTLLWNEYDLLFNKVIPELLLELDPGRQYIASSPLNGWGRQRSMTHGDAHYWGMWWGLEPISIMKTKVPRFMSEYGMQAMPNIESIEEFSIPADYDTSSRVMKIHQKHPTGYQTLANYLSQEKLNSSNFNEYINATQELQSRALDISIESQLRSNNRCMGSLIWQFNDCWPVCSWSIIDYYGRKKKGYFTVQKLFQQNP
jgi:beta-mannosidase